MVEVDSSYYAIPSPQNAQIWTERTPADFIFNIKAFRLFTSHQTEPKALGKDIFEALPAGVQAKRMLHYREMPPAVIDELWRRFRLALDPLEAAGKLSAVHFQFAPWVIPDHDGRAHVQECVDRLAGYQLAVEFRQQIWFDDAHRANTLEWQRELGVAHTIVDSPQITSNSVPVVWDITSTRLAILRLHGRNHGTWNVNRKGRLGSL